MRSYNINHFTTIKSLVRKALKLTTAWNQPVKTIPYLLEETKEGKRQPFWLWDGVWKTEDLQAGFCLVVLPLEVSQQFPGDWGSRQDSPSAAGPSCPPPLKLPETLRGPGKQKAALAKLCNTFMSQLIYLIVWITTEMMRWKPTHGKQ